jgi:DDE family transposase
MSSYQPAAGSATFGHFLQGFVDDENLPFRQVLTAAQIESVAAAEQVAFGTDADAVYSVPLTLWAFIAQVLSDQKSCVAAVARVIVFLTALGREACAAGTGAYCKARAKLPEAFLRRLVTDVGQQLEAHMPRAWRWRGHVVKMVDGSTLSTPDTPANQAVYPQSRSQQPGVGFPLLRWVALIGLATGVVFDSAFGPWRGKETGETALFRTLLDRLQPGDVLLADRYYCSYWMVALAQARGVHVVFRQHHLRHTDFRRGRRLGRNDHVVTWTKPQRPQWMDPETYAAVPDTLTLREVRSQETTRGCRIKELVVVTTLLDDEAYPLEDILDLYQKRWHVEIDLRSIKTHMKMEVLRCRTPAMVHKEIWAHLLAYNLVRKVMAQAAQEHDVTPRQLSFAGAMQTLNEFRTLLLNAGDDALPELSTRILAAIASHRVGNRPNRVEPRKIKRRPKGYSRMLKPRAEERATLLGN